MEEDLDELAALVRAGDVAQLVRRNLAEPDSLRRWQGDRGGSLLFYAREERVVRALLDAGVDPTAPDQFGQLPHLEYCRADHVECLERLLEVLPDSLLDRPMDDGITALHVCAFCDAPRCAESLLTRGADPDRVDDDGFTPLMNAVFGGACDVAAVLVRHGASPWRRTSGGFTCFDIATRNEDHRMLEILGRAEGPPAP